MSDRRAEVEHIVGWLRTRVGAASRRLGDLRLDSRRVEAGDVFVGLPGAAGGSDDGRRYLRGARGRGA